ncbi:nucleoside monophosphate kinase [Candidatus Roizmanbacteria bacterium]|nr:nucleoside monophosphate kinase [Candidatus Roizmanbacteria bacterium]
MKLVLIGIQGSGKSTQGNILSHLFRIPYLSTGHIFREIAKEKTSLGRYMKETINAGILVPDDKTIEIVNTYLSRPEYARGYILDGFPRTLKQAHEFSNNVDKVIYLKIPDKEALWRLMNRHQDRADETLPALRKRIELFHKFTEPVIEYYEKLGKLIELDGTKAIHHVNKEILENLGKQLVKNQLKEWKQNKKAIIALVGLPGAGKSEAAAFFTKKGLPVISFGKIINDYIDKHKLGHTEAVHKKVREELREKYGKEALAVLNKDKIAELLKTKNIIAIDGMRSWEEYLYLKKELKKTHVYILVLYANKQLRYERSSKREYRADLYGEERDINELIGTNMGPTIAFSDFLVKNNFSMKDFHDKLEEVYRQVYFS